jgi:hypothetical protein
MILLIAVIVKTKEIDIIKLVPVALGIIGLIGTPLGSIMTYHYMKGAQKDSKVFDKAKE